MTTGAWTPVPGRLPVLAGDPDALRWDGSLLVVAADEVEHASAALDRLLAGLAGVWFGVAHDAAVGPVHRVQGDMRSLRDGLDDAAATFGAHAAVVEDGGHVLRTLQRELDAGTPVAEVWRRADAVQDEVEWSAEATVRRLLAAESSFDRLGLHAGVWLEIAQTMAGVATAASTLSALRGWEPVGDTVWSADQALRAMVEAERVGLMTPWQASWPGRAAHGLAEEVGASATDASLVASLVARSLSVGGRFDAVLGAIQDVHEGESLDHVLAIAGLAGAAVTLALAVGVVFPPMVVVGVVAAAGLAAVVQLGRVAWRNRKQVERDLRRAGHWLGDRAGWLGRGAEHLGEGVLHRLTGIEDAWRHAGVGW